MKDYIEDYENMTREEIQKIVTYHSELGEGTSGYLLSNEQIDQLLQLHIKGVREIIGKDQQQMVTDDGFDGQYCEVCDCEVNDESECACEIRNKLRQEQRQKLEGLQPKE